MYYTVYFCCRSAKSFVETFAKKYGAFSSKFWRGKPKLVILRLKFKKKKNRAAIKLEKG